MTIMLTSCFILPDEVSLNCEVLEKYLQKVAEGIFMWVIFQHYQLCPLKIFSSLIPVMAWISYTTWAKSIIATTRLEVKCFKEFMLLFWYSIKPL